LKQQEEEYQKEMQAKQARYKAKIASQKAKNKNISKQLAAAKEREEARSRIVKQIKENFRKAGIKADVDEASGEVVLSFGKEYFDTGRSSLKPEMKKILKKFIPVYAKSLFQSEEVAKKLASVEIIGYASPTYKGKYVDPASLSSADKEAVNYNMDLSYRRAKSIFNHIFDKEKMTYAKQKELLPLVKVTGKSFLAEAKRDRGVASGTSVKNFCKKYDCKKAQKVIIKFNLNND
jgi:outer membrane protein OmpA-like peptidoglycan-associated protein